MTEGARSCQLWGGMQFGNVRYTILMQRNYQIFFLKSMCKHSVLGDIVVMWGCMNVINSSRIVPVLQYSRMSCEVHKIHTYCMHAQKVVADP